jgi:putative FmdB family regulatory protein
VTYEYECTNCYHEWEEEQKITDKPIKKCPKCKLEAAHRMISKSGFVLNGTCWAKDGYSG